MPDNKHDESIGPAIVSRLHAFVEEVEAGFGPTERLTARTIRLNLEPQEYSPEKVKEARKLLGASQRYYQ